MAIKNSQSPKSEKLAKQKTHLKVSFIRKLFYIVALLLIIYLVLYFIRGWIRVTLIPKTASHFYTNSISNTLAVENSDLQHPFSSLGYKTTTRNSSCTLGYALSFRTQINCSVAMQSYTKLPSDKNGHANIENQAQKLQKLLSTSKWQGGGNGVTITSLINGTYKGIDYSPDAFYEKFIGNYDCIFDTMIAYSNPQPPAITSSLTCYRTINILGEPYPY